MDSGDLVSLFKYCLLGRGVFQRNRANFLSNAYYLVLLKNPRTSLKVS